MKKYRKKPVVVNAEKYDGSHAQALRLKLAPGLTRDETEFFHYIPTLEGDIKVQKGDWIVQGVNGEFYPCKPDIFDKTYEPVIG